MLRCNNSTDNLNYGPNGINNLPQISRRPYEFNNLNLNFNRLSYDKSSKRYLTKKSNFNNRTMIFESTLYKNDEGFEKGNFDGLNTLKQLELRKEKLDREINDMSLILKELSKEKFNLIKEIENIRNDLIKLKEEYNDLNIKIIDKKYIYDMNIMEEKLNKKKEKLKQRNIELKIKETNIYKENEKINKEEKLIAKKYEDINKKEKLLKEKEKEINEQIIQLEKEKKEFNDEIAKKYEDINEKEKLLKKKENEINKQIKQIKQLEKDKKAFNDENKNIINNKLDNIFNKNMTKQEIISDVSYLGSFLKDSITKEKKSNPDNFIEPKKYIKKNETINKTILPLYLLFNWLEENGCQVAIEKEPKDIRLNKFCMQQIFNNKAIEKNLLWFLMISITTIMRIVIII